MHLGTTAAAISTVKTGVEMTAAKPRTRIQEMNRALVLGAALEVFSGYGFRGATIDAIAAEAGLSKPNLLYYFASKEEIHVTLLEGLVDTWLAPLRTLNADGDPTCELLAYVRRKLQMSRDYPRESRLFAQEIVQGAPRMHTSFSSDLKVLVDEKAQVIHAWMIAGQIAPSDPHHLIFSIWSLTQHYADFDVQVRAVLGEGRDPIDEAEEFLNTLFTRLLAVRP